MSEASNGNSTLTIRRVRDMFVKYLGYKKLVVLLFVVAGLAFLAEPTARAGVQFAFAFPIPVPFFYGPGYYYGPGPYFGPPYYGYYGPDWRPWYYYGPRYYHRRFYRHWRR
jgi:hypothetical protein